MTLEELDRQLAQADISKTPYQADMELYDRSQGFSSELLKLALAGITVVGFFVAQLPKTYQERVFENSTLRKLLIGAVAGFAASVACALVHRFLAGGANFHHLRFAKLLKIKSEFPDPLVESALKESWALRDVKFRWSHRFLRASSLLLLGAASLLGAAFVSFMTKP